MPTASFTLYKLQPSNRKFKDYCNEIINNYNQNLSEKIMFKELSNLQKPPFSKVSNLKVYYAQSITKPDWQFVLNDLVSNLPQVENINHSFVLFLECQDNVFAFTGGRGYLVLPDYKDYNFGLVLLSKILEANERVVKETSDKYLSGNRASGQSQFLGLVTLNSERSISNFFKSIDVFFTKEKLEELFGIKIDAGRKDYKFVARDSIRLGKSLSVSEMDLFINSICNLLNHATISQINNFYEVNSKDPIYKELYRELEQEILTSANHLDEENEELSLIQFQTNCDEYKLIKKTSGSVLQSYESHLGLTDLLILYNEKFKEKIERADNKNVLDDFIKQILVEGFIEGEIAVKAPLINLLEFKVLQNFRVYWLIDGKWLYLNQRFINGLNTQFIEKVTSKFNQTRIIEKLKSWPRGLSEGEYNFSHQDIENVFVLDRIFVNNIELCDLLIIEESESYIVHVKDGLDRDARVLSEQIMASMTALHNALHYGDVDFFVKYYQNIVNKIKNPNGRNEESNISRAARKFQIRFPSKQQFLAWINNPQLKHHFIFAFRPGSQDINHPSTISSAPAKIAMVNLVDYVKKFDFDLGIVKIDTV